MNLDYTSPPLLKLKCCSTDFVLTYFKNPKHNDAIIIDIEGAKNKDEKISLISSK